MKKGKLYYVYIMASYRRVLYIGITSKLEQRVWQHKQGVFPEGFSARYRIHKLVYFETYSDIAAAIAREKELKGWLRSRKIALLPVRTPATNIAQDAASPDPSFGRKRRAQDDTLDKHLRLEEHNRFFVIQLKSEDSTNRLTRARVCALIHLVHKLAEKPKPLILKGNKRFFCAGADLHEIAALAPAQAYEFAKMGQSLMNAIDQFPAPVYAAIEGYCMGGGLDLALACAFRIAAPNAILGHRGAALGLITGWGGTQRLPRLIGKGRALQMFCAAEKLDAARALHVGLVDAIAEDPLQEISQRLHV